MTDTQTPETADKVYTDPLRPVVMKRATEYSARWAAVDKSNEEELMKFASDLITDYVAMSTRYLRTRQIVRLKQEVIDDLNRENQALLDLFPEPEYTHSEDFRLRVVGWFRRLWHRP